MAYVVGGESLYKEALYNEKCKAVIITQIIEPRQFCCDVFFPYDIIESHYYKTDITEKIYNNLFQEANIYLEESKVMIEGEFKLKIFIFQKKIKCSTQ